MEDNKEQKLRKVGAKVIGGSNHISVMKAFMGDPEGKVSATPDLKPDLNVIKTQAEKAQATYIAKSITPLAEPDENYYEIISPPYNLRTLMLWVEQSTILQQCIKAYEMNIAGFGYHLEYNDDLNETPEMKAEWDFVLDQLEDFNHEKDFQDVWAQAIFQREATGNAWIEVLRNDSKKPTGLYNVNPMYFWITMEGEPIEVNYITAKGKQSSYWKKFRRYVQMNLDGRYIWFKEFGDPRIMDARSGQFVEGGLEDKHTANELIHLKIENGGYTPYGIPRWTSHIIHMAGARKADELNLNYFENGRHIPLAVVIEGGQLTPEAEAELISYSDGLKGVDNAHKILVIEVEGLSNDPEMNKNISVKLQPLTAMLQDDGLFLKYDEQSRKKVQSAFRLQDLYTGYSSNFNRATAEVARQVTEEQVFIPEREKLESIINRQLFADYGLKHVRIKFDQPEVSTAQEKAYLLRELNNAGALSPNDLREEAGKLLGINLEDFDFPEANVPIAIAKLKAGIVETPDAAANDGNYGTPESDQTAQNPVAPDANNELTSFTTNSNTFSQTGNNPGIPGGAF